MRTARERVDEVLADCRCGNIEPDKAIAMLEEHERDLVEAIAAYLAVKLDDNRTSILIRSSAWRNPVAKPPAIGAAPLTIGGVYSFTGDAETGGTFTLAGGTLEVFCIGKTVIFKTNGTIEFGPGETVYDALDRAAAMGHAERYICE